MTAALDDLNGQTLCLVQMDSFHLDESCVARPKSTPELKRTLLNSLNNATPATLAGAHEPFLKLDANPKRSPSVSCPFYIYKRSATELSFVVHYTTS